MTQPPKAVQTARRNLSQRIARLITKLEEEAREPTPAEAHHVSIALGHLEFDRYPDGEWTMLHAERGLGDLPADARKATAAELRARLAGLYEE